MDSLACRPIRNVIPGGIARVAVIVLVMLAGLRPEDVRGATVLGTDAVLIRACPSLDCDVVGTAPLGASLDITGELQDGFAPVTWQGISGFAFHLFLSDTGVSPWLVQGEADCDQVALIFNIGIGFEPSESILDTLTGRGAAATMFPMGWWAPQHPEYLRRLNDAGFVIGTHGDQRTLLTNATDEAVLHDVKASIVAIEAVIERPIDPWATPYAAATDERVRALVAGLGIMPVGWTVAANDYGASATGDAVYARIMKGVHPGAIVEFHLDGPATERSTAIALPRIIDELRSQGYDLVTVPELAKPCPSRSGDDPEKGVPEG